MRRLVVLIAPLLAVAGCARTDLDASAERERLGARRMLAQAAAAGPVPLVVAGDPGPLDPGSVPALAARGIAGLDPAFAPADPGASATGRLVLWFGPPPAATAQEACGPGPLAGGAASGPPALLGAWCDGPYPVASVAGTADGPGRGEAERLVWRTTQRLFPDDYAETYGINLFGWRVRLGGSASF